MCSTTWDILTWKTSWSGSLPGVDWPSGSAGLFLVGGLSRVGGAHRLAFLFFYLSLSLTHTRAHTHTTASLGWTNITIFKGVHNWTCRTGLVNSLSKVYFRIRSVFRMFCKELFWVAVTCCRHGEGEKRWCGEITRERQRSQEADAARRNKITDRPDMFRRPRLAAANRDC